MQVEAIQNEVSRMRALERAQMLAALRRSDSSTSTTGATSAASELGRPFDAFLSASIPPAVIPDSTPDFKNGVLA
jgi:hypothetical protein